MFGPLLVTPALALSFSAALIAGARLEQWHRAIVITLATSGTLLPALLEWLRGSWSYAVGDSGLLVIPSVIELGDERVLLVLSVMAALAVIAPSMLIGRSVDVLHKAEENQFAQAWRMRQIFPDELRGG
jgi:hypothetical protein